MTRECSIQRRCTDQLKTITGGCITLNSKSLSLRHKNARSLVDWFQFLKHFLINVSFHTLVASLTLMTLSLRKKNILDRAIRVRLATSI